MRPTSRGNTVLAILLALGASAVLFKDSILYVFFVIVLIAVVAEITWFIFVTHTPNKFFYVGRAEGESGDTFGISETVPQGELKVSERTFVKRVRGGVSLRATSIPYLKLIPAKFDSSERESKIQFEFRSPFSGAFEVEHINARLFGPLRLFESQTRLSFSIKYGVYPRVYDVALETAKILGKSGIGEIPIEFPGIGTEFYGMREYVSGDDLRKVNWKASARLGSLIVNDRMREVGASYFLVIDAASTNYFDRDRIATTFLQLANILAILGVNFGFLVSDGERPTSGSNPIDRPSISLPPARNAALTLCKIGGDPRSAEELVSPLSSSALRSKQVMFAKSGLALFSELENIARRQIAASFEQNDNFHAVVDVIRGYGSEPPAVVYVGAASAQLALLIELSSQLKRGYSTEFTVLDPTEPWVTAPDEEEATRLYELRLKNLRTFASSRVEYLVGEPLKIVEQLLG